MLAHTSSTRNSFCRILGIPMLVSQMIILKLNVDWFLKLWSNNDYYKQQGQKQQI